MKQSSIYRILAVDDDNDILELLKYNLEKEAYEVRVLDDGTKTFEVASAYHPDLILLDIMMPDISGIEVCKQLRKSTEFRNTYIFFLTAKSDNYYKVAALDTGGDDFIDKLTGLRALTHKVGNVLKGNLVIRKSVKEISVGNLVINRSSNLAKLGQKAVSLTDYEFELLFFFAQNSQKEISKDSLISSIWGSEIYLLTKSVDTYIRNICKKFGRDLIAKVGNERYRLQPWSNSQFAC